MRRCGYCYYYWLYQKLPLGDNKDYLDLEMAIFSWMEEEEENTMFEAEEDESLLLSCAIATEMEENSARTELTILIIKVSTR